MKFVQRKEQNWKKGEGEREREGKKETVYLFIYKYWNQYYDMRIRFYHPSVACIMIS